MLGCALLAADQVAQRIGLDVIAVVPCQRADHLAHAVLSRPDGPNALPTCLKYSKTLVILVSSDFL